MSAPRHIPDHIIGQVDAALRAGLRDWSVKLLGEPNPAVSTRDDWRWGRNGSRSIRLSGRTAGACADFESGETYSPINFVKHVLGCSWLEAVAWGAQWAGIAIDGAAVARPDPAEVAKRAEAARIERERRDAESAAEAAEREEGARRWWSRRVPLAGTLGERYLASRGIEAPAGGWPSCLAWVTHSTISLRRGGPEFSSAGSVIVAATDADRVVCAVQRIALDAEARNVRTEAGAKIKPSRGNLRDAGAVVRLPGDPDGPLLLAEGPETGLSVWVATGHETWVALGSISHHCPPLGRRVVACRDDDAADAPSDRALNKALAAWRTDGANVVVATPWDVRRYDRSDFNDVLQSGGAAAVRARIEVALYPHGKPPARLPVDQARAELAAGTDAFFSAAGGFNRQVAAIERNVLPRHVEAARAAMSPAAAEWDRAREAVGAAQAALHAAEAVDGGADVHAARAALVAARARRAAAKAEMTDEDQKEAERLRRRAKKDAEDEAWRIAGDPPVHAMRIDVGGGKSWAARNGSARLLLQMRKAGDTRPGVMFVPRVALGDEQAEAFAAIPEAVDAGLVARVWRGRDQPDPAADGFDDPSVPKDRKIRMCRDLQAMKDAQAVMADVQSSVCERKMRGAEVHRCAYFDECAYQKQRNASADLWVMAHEMAFSASRPETIGEPAFVIFDENFTKAGMVGMDGNSPLVVSVDSLSHDTTVVGDDIGGQRLASLRTMLADVIDQLPEGPVSREAVVASGLEPASAVEAAKLEWQRKVEPEIIPGMSRRARAEAVEAARVNRTIKPMAMMWKAIEALVSPDGPERSGWLSVEVRDLPGAGKVRCLRLRGRSDIKEHWQAPTLIINATLQVEMVRPFFPNVIVTRDVAIAMPHMHITQVSDQTYSKTHFDDKSKNTDIPLRDLHDVICREASRLRGKVLVVTQLFLQEKLETFTDFPANVEFAHFNGVSGIDRWRDVEGMIICGRTSPQTANAELQAEALSGVAIERITVTRDDAADNECGDGARAKRDRSGRFPKAPAAYEMRDGTMVPTETDRHPDPLAEAFRWNTAEGELLQVIGRCRGANRTASNPVSILLMTSVPLPLPVDRLVTADDVAPSLSERQLKAEGVALENPADAAVAFPKMWGTVKAARLAYGRHRFHSLPHFPFSNLIMESEVEKAIPSRESMWADPIRVRYQRAGRGQRECIALVRRDLAASAATLVAEKLGGALVRCEVVPGNLAKMEPVALCVPDAPECAPVDPAAYGLPAPMFGGFRWGEQAFAIRGQDGASRLLVMAWPALPPDPAPMSPRPVHPKRRTVVNDFDPNASVSAEAMLRGLLAGSLALGCTPENKSQSDQLAS